MLVACSGCEEKKPVLNVETNPLITLDFPHITIRNNGSTTLIINEDYEFKPGSLYTTFEKELRVSQCE